ncbi:hypothetical protein [Nocardioides sp. 616]|uniref:SCO6745 family protein n=1 Tax=Nocardioides sp. 616 TaxID=2268090 RepID=UPI000CE410F0|nr:hypothetical protein [Nocardioides sp. 616]
MSTHPRQLWRMMEPYHQLSYRSAEGVEQMSALGLDRPELQYFGARLCALGPVSAEVAAALTFGFAPAYVARAVPEVWQRADPEDILAARLEAADATLRRVLGDHLAETAEVAGLVRRAAEACDLGGHPMAAAHLAVEWPDAPHLQLWLACTVLREHRGDAHWATTTAMGIDPVECHVLACADGYMPAEMLHRHTGWDDAAWQAAVDRLVARGLVVDEDHATAEGTELKSSLERTTDRLAAAPLGVLSEAEQATVLATMTPFARMILDAGEAQPWRLREQLWREPEPV